ncbi:MAG TPA: TIGR00730 family Rossman fold protein [Candidatus Sulfotelmatobacter sp.]|nr:TIGR00730 family Rossman fold protein [Candidatus Sulfotelmatobacter sp.]
MTVLSSLCVYCGSATGTDPAHRQAAATLGRLLASHDVALVYGGGRIGLMGVCADAVLDAGGRVIGVIPEHLNKVEIGHRGVSKLHVVPSMHVRKQMMFELADAFAVLPGGIGTLDETFEIITWRYLGLHDKPIVLVDNKGYWRPFLGLIDHVIATGFAKPAIRALYQVVERVEDVIPAVTAAPQPALAAAAERL